MAPVVFLITFLNLHSLPPPHLSFPIRRCSSSVFTLHARLLPPSAFACCVPLRLLNFYFGCSATPILPARSSLVPRLARTLLPTPTVTSIDRPAERDALDNLLTIPIVPCRYFARMYSVLASASSILPLGLNFVFYCKHIYVPAGLGVSSIRRS